MYPTKAVFPSYVTQPRPTDESAGTGQAVDACRVEAGLSPSLAEGGPSLFTTMAVGLILLPAAGGAAVSTQDAPDFPDPALRLLSQYVGRLVASGKANQGYISERHFLLGNLDIVTAAWQGALNTAVGEVSLWREVNKDNAGKEDVFAVQMKDQGIRTRGAPLLANTIARGRAHSKPGTPEEADAARRFQQAMSHPNATFNILCFFNPKRPSLSRFVANQAAFSFASVGFEHAEAVRALKDLIYDPVTSVGSRVSSDYPESVIGSVRQEDMFGGLEKSRAAGRLVIDIGSTAIQARQGEKPAPGQRERYIDRHLAQGGAVMELVSPAGNNITVVVPPEAVEESLAFVSENPGQARFFCGDLLGCETPAAPNLHDET